MKISRLAAIAACCALAACSAPASPHAPASTFPTYEGASVIPSMWSSQEMNPSVVPTSAEDKSVPLQFEIMGNRGYVSRGFVGLRPGADEMTIFWKNVSASDRELVTAQVEKFGLKTKFVPAPYDQGEIQSIGDHLYTPEYFGKGVRVLTLHSLPTETDPRVVLQWTNADGKTETPLATPSLPADFVAKHGDHIRFEFIKPSQAGGPA